MIKFIKKYMFTTRNEALVYFAMLSLIFTVMLFIPFLLIILYNAAYMPTFKNSLTIRLHNNYKWKYNDSYGVGNNEKFENFKATLKEIDRLNAIESSNVFGLTKFSHMSKEEFAQQMLLADADFTELSTINVMPCHTSAWDFWSTRRQSLYYFNTFIRQYYYHNGGIPAHFDWRESGKVGPILDQKRCNACWAFSVVGLMESMLAIRWKKPLSELSIQELVDCSAYNKKCKGGNIKSAMAYLCLYRLAIVPASQYPLTLHDDEGCLVNENVTGTTLREFTVETNVPEHVIPRLIANHGPVMVMLTANIWQYYTGGIIYRSCKRNDSGYQHVVQIVGYDMNGPIPYYIVRNSWGTDFGEDGYVRLAMNEDACGITRIVAYLDVW